MLEQLPARRASGKNHRRGIDLNKARMRRVIRSAARLSPHPTASPPPRWRLGWARTQQAKPHHSRSRHAAYDLKKNSAAKHIIRRIGHHPPLRAAADRSQGDDCPSSFSATKPSNPCSPRSATPPKRGAHNPKPIDLHYDAIQAAMKALP